MTSPYVRFPSELQAVPFHCQAQGIPVPVATFILISPTLNVPVDGVPFEVRTSKPSTGSPGPAPWPIANLLTYVTPLCPPERPKVCDELLPENRNVGVVLDPPPVVTSTKAISCPATPSTHVTTPLLPGIMGVIIVKPTPERRILPPLQ
jgi:hypothetical protein